MQSKLPFFLLISLYILAGFIFCTGWIFHCFLWPSNVIQCSEVLFMFYFYGSESLPLLSRVLLGWNGCRWELHFSVETDLQINYAKWKCQCNFKDL